MNEEMKKYMEQWLKEREDLKAREQQVRMRAPSLHRV